MLTLPKKPAPAVAIELVCTDAALAVMMVLYHVHLQKLQKLCSDGRSRLRCNRAIARAVPT